MYLDSAEQIVAMIDAATELDAKPQARTAGRRALIATLVYAGLRIGEATALTWQDIDLANGRISVGDSKTEAGIRLVDILPALRDELTSHRHARAGAGPTDLVFPTSAGSRRDKDNARERVIRPVIAHAHELLARRGETPLPAGVSAHKLRHTFASILYVRGEDPPYVMAQLGHTDAGFTLRVYAHAMRREEGDKERLKALVEGRDWAPLGTTPGQTAPADACGEAPGNDETPADAGASEDGRGGFRTCDLSRVKQRGASALRAFMPGNQPNRMPRTVIGSSPIRSSTAAFGPTIGPTEESASCRRRVVCSVTAHAQRLARWLWIRPYGRQQGQLVCPPGHRALAETLAYA